MSDRIFRDMKEQMVPSDAVVSGLLAQISALEAAKTEENVIAADFAKPAKAVNPAPKKKPVWFYGTCAVASALVLMSTLSLFGTDGENARDLFNDIVNNPAVVLQDGDTEEKVTDNNGDAVLTDTGKTDEAEGEATEEIKNGDKEDENTSESADKTPEDKKQETQKPAAENGKPASEQPAAPKTDDNAGSGNKGSDQKPPKKDTPKADKPKDDNSGNDGSNAKTDTPKTDEPKDSSRDDSKVTPGASGAADIAFTREILAEAALKSIQVDDSNYVVPTVISGADTVSNVGTMDLKLDETSTTNRAVVNATIKKLRGVSSDLAVAVDVDGFSGSLIYTNKDYNPGTLGQLVQDAGLSAASYGSSVRVKGESLGFSSTRNIQVTNLSSLLGTYIFSNTNASKVSKSNFDSGNAFCYFKSSSNPTGSTIDFSVSDNGYIYIKMSAGNSFTFHIGEDAAAAFIQAVCGA